MKLALSFFEYNIGRECYTYYNAIYLNALIDPSTYEKVVLFQRILFRGSAMCCNSLKKNIILN